jgi:FAD/FMN-containing dehydrogenase
MTGGHGVTKALGRLENAIQIDLRAMDRVDLAPDGKTATIGGGTKIKKMVRELWAVGKQTGKSISPNM